MIWLFKINEVFWANEPQVNEHYLFEVDDVNFDMNEYDISLYFGTANYYLIDSKDNEIYYLQYSGSRNPIRIKADESSVYYKCIKDYYMNNPNIKRKLREYKLNKLI